MLEIAMGVDDIITGEIDENIRKTNESLSRARKELPKVIAEYAARVSQHDYVTGVYFGINGLNVNLLTVVDSRRGISISGCREILRTDFAHGEDLILDHRMYDSVCKNLEELERDREIFDAFMDDEHSGENVKRIYPLP